MKYHILNGDALYENLPLLEGVAIVMRECLIDGPVHFDDYDAFVDGRAGFIAKYFDTNKNHYLKKSKPELDQIRSIDSDDEVFLWFEDDLFCQTNLWWCCHQLFKNNCFTVSLVRPNHKDWKGFGIMDEEDLKSIYQNRIDLTQSELGHFSKLWKAYSTENDHQLLVHAEKLEHLILRIKKVVNAHIDRNRQNDRIGRPERLLLEIKENGVSDFGEVFKVFSSKMGIYGYGDLQVKEMWVGLK